MVVAYLIPDTPARVKQLVLRELYLAKEARYETSFATVHRDKEVREEIEARNVSYNQATPPPREVEQIEPV